jgi:hypothetical protein
MPETYRGRLASIVAVALWSFDSPVWCLLIIGFFLEVHVPKDVTVKVVAVIGDEEAFEFAGKVHTWLVENEYHEVLPASRAMFSSPLLPGQHLRCNKEKTVYRILIGSRLPQK